MKLKNLKKNENLKLINFFLLLIFCLLTSFKVYTQDRKTITSITIGSEPDYPPYCIVDENGEPDGFSIDLFKAAANSMGVEVKINIGLWNTIKIELTKGSLDALPLVGLTPEREALFDFTFPYLSLHGGIVTRKDNTEINNFNDLVAKRVAVMNGDNAEEFLRRTEKEIDIITTPTFMDALKLVAENECDAVVLQRLVGYRLIHEGNFTDLRVIDASIPEFRQDFCFAVQEGNKDLLSLLNEGLALTIADGTFRRLQGKWFAALELPNRRIIVGGDRNYPPYEFLDKNGQPTGYNVDLTKAIARELNLNIEIQLEKWSEVKDKLTRGEIDALQGMLYSPERDEIYDFSQAHTINHYVAVARKNEGFPPSNIESLRGTRTIAEKEDIMHEFAEKNGLSEELTLVEDQEEALRLLSVGLYDYALVGRLTALHLIEKNDWDNLIMGRDSLLAPEYCYAVQNGRKSILTLFSEGLAVLEETGEYRRIYDKWLGIYKPSSLTFKEIFHYVILIVAPLLVIITAILIWIRLLRHQVAVRTKELRKNEQRNHYLIDLLERTGSMAKVGGWEFDPVTRKGTWTKEVAHIHGVDPQIPTNTKIGISFYTEVSKKKIEDAIDAAIAFGQPYDLELEMRSVKGTQKWIRTIGKPIMKDGKVVKVVGSFQDITQQKQTEKELRTLKEELEQKVTERTQQLQEKVDELDRSQKAMLYMIEDLNRITKELKEQRHKLEATNKELESFSYSVSHDLRAPLRAIDGFSRIIEEEYFSFLDPEGQRLLTIIRDNTKKMDILITDLLELSRAGRMEMKFSEIDMTATARSMYHEVATGEVSNVFQFNLSKIPRAYADPKLIRQVWSNLISNAIKYTLPKKEKIIRISGYSTEGSHVYSVRDTGVGFNPAYKAKLFDLFQRLHSSEQFEGTGVGLAIVQRIIHRHGGRVWAEAEEDSGAVFYFSLPDKNTPKKEENNA